MIKNLSAWYANSSGFTDISKYLVDGLSIRPQHTVDSGVPLGQSGPTLHVLGVSYTATIPQAYYDDALRAIDTDDTGGYLVLFDLVQKQAAVMPAALMAPRAADVQIDPGRVVRTPLSFTTPEDDRPTVHSWAAASGGTAKVVARSSGITVSAQGSAAHSVAVAGTGAARVLTIIGQTGV